ncbi:hypothetical protein [Desulfovibrio sp. UCD-KL4C]|uniref:hypothetical protein n=1 Tax=Desulfovibrio sp. UCD-KL4C TaxID=2578120 RepID=UPI0025C642B3|nr:hypothetical protein [Desulfovibrio sp. UCD-KL4C]
MNVLFKSLITVFVLCLCFASFVQASSSNGYYDYHGHNDHNGRIVMGNNWYNEAAGVKSMQLWVTNPDVSIKNVSFKYNSLDGWSWSYSGDSKNSVILTGPATSGAREVLPNFEFKTPGGNKISFDVEWAEIGGSNVLTGTNSYENKKWTYTQGDISNSPTPLPGALLLMGGGLSVLVFLRRKFAK